MEYYLPTRVVFGEGSVKSVGEFTSKLGGRALFVATNKARTARRTGYYDLIMKSLREFGVEVSEFTDVENNPSIETCEKGADVARGFEADVVVAFGGGSALDAAKAIAASASLGRSVRELLYPERVEGNVMPLVAIPTTCGTGSEVTKYSILTDVGEVRKVAMVGDAIIPKVALVDPETLRSLPPNLVAWTAMDALSHAIEAYISINSTPFTDPLALHAVKLILEYGPSGYRKESEGLRNLHLASTLAGVAINTAGSTAIHALGYHLTAKYGVHHGLANAVMMVPTLKLTLPAAPEWKLTGLFRYVGVKNVSEFLGAIEVLMTEMRVPRKLRELGIPEEAVGELSERALTYERNLRNTPKELSREEVERIVREAYG